MKQIQYSYVKAELGLGIVVIMKDLDDLRKNGQIIGYNNLKEKTEYNGVNLCWQPWNNTMVLDDIEPKGKIPSSNMFDGVTCVDNKEKLYFNT